MHIVAVADLHGTLPKIPECDLLLIAGDVCPVENHDRKYQAWWLRNEFGPWLKSLPAKEIVAVGGNHDFVLMDSLKFKKELPWHLLYDEEIIVDGLKIWGSPWTPRFGNWAFMKPDNMLVEHWDKIPHDVDILMTHGPYHGSLDLVPSRVAKPVIDDKGKMTWYWGEEGSGEHTGSASLRNKLTYNEYPNLKLFVCGHIHEGYGTGGYIGSNASFKTANVSLMNGQYEPLNLPMEFDL